MGKKIKITEKQFNMIVETIVKNNHVNENINEEQLEEGKLSQIAGALAILATTLFPGKSEAAAVAQMQKEYPELVQKVQDETPVDTIKSVEADTVDKYEKADMKFDIASKTTHGDFLKSLSQQEYNMIFAPGGFQKSFLPKVLGTTWDSIKADSYENYIKKLNDVLGSRKYDEAFSTNSITYFKDKFGEDNVEGLQKKLADAGYTEYKPDGSKGKSNIDGDFGTGTAKMIIDMMVKRLSAIKDKAGKVGKSTIDPSKLGKPSTGVGLAPKVQPKSSRR